MVTFKLSNQWITFPILLVPIVLLLSCEKCLEPSIDDNEQDDSRITSISIDGVKLGDSQEEVLTLLGNANKTGIICGIGPSWYIWGYDEGPHSGLSILFVEMINNTSTICGPVVGITVSGSYTGTTTEGIGIGSKISDVHKFYKYPTSSLEDEYPKRETYAFEKSYMSFFYVKDIVQSITIESEKTE